MLSCTFAGHREVFHAGVADTVEAALRGLMEKDSEFCFYVGGMGEFDALCTRTVRKLRLLTPEKQIRLVLVEPYMKQSINSEGRWLYSLYDEILIPDDLTGIHYKAAITRRNQWMIEHSQHLIAYVRRDHGGAFATLQYAQRCGLDVVRV